MSIPEARSIIIREIATDEMRAVEDLQVETWGCSEREVLPSLALIPLKEVGGVLLGAFDSQLMIGFVFGFPGMEAGHPILHSDMLAVKTEYRSLGLGYRLKLAQREYALARGLNRITWTFDPLQSRNAHLNFAKLGVVSDRYCPDYYGTTSSFLHQTGTDRLWVTWLLESDRVTTRLEGTQRSGISPDLDNAQILVEQDEHQEPQIAPDAPSGTIAAIEIPSDINTLIVNDIDLARRWRKATREAFTNAIKLGYLIEEFYGVERRGRKTGLYLLKKGAG